jgi:hypothetical protein
VFFFSLSFGQFYSIPFKRKAQTERRDEAAFFLGGSSYGSLMERRVNLSGIEGNRSVPSMNFYGSFYRFYLEDSTARI